MSHAFIRPIDEPTSALLDHDAFRSNRPKSINVIDSSEIEHDVVRKPVPTFRHHALAAEAAASNSIDVLEALLAAAAMMAHADGEMAGTERRKILALVRETPALSVFSRDEVIDEIGTHEANYRLDPEVAHLLAREKLVRVAGNRRLAHEIVNACRTILAADGIAHPSEYRALAEIRGMLGFEAVAPSRPQVGIEQAR